MRTKSKADLILKSPNINLDRVTQSLPDIGGKWEINYTALGFFT